MPKPKRSLSSSSEEDALLSDGGDPKNTGNGKKKKPRRPQYDETRKQEIRETNKLAARECRARKKRLMSELEKTVGSLTAEHSALVKQNRELAIRLETLQRTVGPPPQIVASAGGFAGTTPQQLATVANSATSLLSGLSRGGQQQQQQQAMNGNSLMMPNAAQMALLAQLNANTNPNFQNQQMLSQMMLASNNGMMTAVNNAAANTNTNAGSGTNTPNLNNLGLAGNGSNTGTTPKQIQFFPTSTGTTSAVGTSTLTGVGAATNANNATNITGNGTDAAASAGAPSASPGNPPLKQNGQLPPVTMNAGGLTI